MFQNAFLKHLMFALHSTETMVPITYRVLHKHQLEHENIQYARRDYEHLGSIGYLATYNVKLVHILSNTSSI
jgi:hypothetical protein